MRTTSQIPAGAPAIQNELRVSRIKRQHKTHLDKLISEYAKIYDLNWECCEKASRAVSVSVQRQQRWAGIETASESDIETISVVTVWLQQCQCQSSAEPALVQRWRPWQYSRVRQQR